MARPLRIEFPNAIYHVMARGNGRQKIFHADADYQRMTDGLAKTVARTGWQVFAFVWMPNHIHLFVRTPKPNLSVGMQYLLSGLREMVGLNKPAIVRIMTPDGGHAVIVDSFTKRMGKQVVSIRNPHGVEYYQPLNEFMKVFTGHVVRLQ